MISSSLYDIGTRKIGWAESLTISFSGCFTSQNLSEASITCLFHFLMSFNKILDIKSCIFCQLTETIYLPFKIFQLTRWWEREGSTAATKKMFLLSLKCRIQNTFKNTLSDVPCSL